MANMTLPLYIDPTSGLNLVPLPPNIIPLGGATFVPTPPIRANSLTRLDELQQFLIRCDEPSYLENYYQFLVSSDQEMVDKSLQALIKRAEWLDDQQAIEMRKMASLGIVNEQLAAALTGCTDSQPQVDKADADTFANLVLGVAHANETPAPAAPRASTPLTPSVQHLAVAQHQIQNVSVTPPHIPSTTSDIENAKETKKSARQKKIQVKMKNTR